MTFGSFIGRVQYRRTGAQPVNMSLTAYDNVITPEEGPDGSSASKCSFCSLLGG